MRKVISFDKNLEFKTMIGEVTSISLDPSLEFSLDGDISGELVISGKYKLTTASRIEEDFSFSLPIEIALSEALDESTRNVYIDDFRYKIEDDDILNCHIDLVVEGVEKVCELVEEDMDEKIVSDVESLRDEAWEEGSKESSEIQLNQNVSIVEQVNTVEVEKEEEEHSVGSLFSSFKDSDESFATYSVYIVRENDTVDTIMSKYNVHREELEDYNDLGNLVVGSKVIIPTQHE